MAKKELNTYTKIIITDEHTIRNKIYEVRGMKVMLDFELAEIYGYNTNAFNQQVKNNAEKFEGEDFCFYLTTEEFANLMSKNLTSSWGGRRKPPKAFTEQGIYMLMTVLKGDLAVQQSKALIRTFRAIKDYIVENQGLIGRQEYLRLSMQISDNIKENIKIRKDLDVLTDDMKEVFDKLSDVVLKSEIAPILLELRQAEDKREYLFLNGQPMKAVDAYIDIYSKAKRAIHIIDDYIGPKTLHLLQGAKDKVTITLISDNKGNYLKASDYKDFQKEFLNKPITFIQSKDMSHDRFIILDYGTKDERLFHCGASSKDAGYKATSIVEFNDFLVKNAFNNLLCSMLLNPPLVLK